jgi:microcompartment protein CcmL/EutN
MIHALAVLETVGLTPAMVAVDAMVKSASVHIAQIELNDLYGVCVKITGATADVQTALHAGRRIAEQMSPRPISTLMTRVAPAAWPAIRSAHEYNPLIQQDVVFPALSLSRPPGVLSLEGERTQSGALVNSVPPTTAPRTGRPSPSASTESTPMNEGSAHPSALGFIETQGFTAVFEAIDTACKAADVQVVGKEKLGGGYVTIVIQGELSAVTAAISAGRSKVGELGKLIAAHVIARPSPAVLSLLPKL